MSGIVDFHFVTPPDWDQLMPLQCYQHLFSYALEEAADVLDEREQAALKHYVIQRALVELTRTRVA